MGVRDLLLDHGHGFARVEVLGASLGTVLKGR